MNQRDYIREKLMALAELDVIPWAKKLDTYHHVLHRSENGSYVIIALVDELFNPKLFVIHTPYSDNVRGSIYPDKYDRREAWAKVEIPITKAVVKSIKASYNRLMNVKDQKAAEDQANRNRVLLDFAFELMEKK
jgi:hypothetical protein